MNDRNKYKVIGQMNHQTVDSKANASEFLFFPIAHLLKTILAKHTNGTFVFAQHTSQRFAKQKESFFATTSKEVTGSLTSDIHLILKTLGRSALAGFWTTGGNYLEQAYWDIQAHPDWSKFQKGLRVGAVASSFMEGVSEMAGALFFENWLDRFIKRMPRTTIAETAMRFGANVVGGNIVEVLEERINDLFSYDLWNATVTRKWTDDSGVVHEGRLSYFKNMLKESGEEVDIPIHGHSSKERSDLESNLWIGYHKLGLEAKHQEIIKEEKRKKNDRLSDMVADSENSKIIDDFAQMLKGTELFEVLREIRTVELLKALRIDPSKEYSIEEIIEKVRKNKKA